MRKNHLRLTGLLACCMVAMLSCRKTESPATTAGADNARAKQGNALISGPVPTGTYRIFTNLTWGSTQRTLGVDNNSYDAGAVLKQLNYVEKTSRDWRITDLGNGYHIIVNAYTGQAVTASNTNEHTSVIQFPFGKTVPDNQQWKIEFQGLGMYRIRAKQALTKGLHVDPSSTIHGATIKIQTYSTAVQNEGYFLIEPTVAAYYDRTATNFFNRTSGWTNGDGASSIPLSNGKVMWLMDDSYTGSVNAFGTVPCMFSVNNCVIMQASTTNWNDAATTVYAGTNQYGLFRSNTSTPDHYNWTNTGFEISGTAYVYCANIKAGSPYPSHEAIDRFGKFDISTNTVTGYVPLPSGYRADLDAIDGDKDGRIRFGHGFVKDGSYIYALGLHLMPVPGFLDVSNLYVARFLATAAGVSGTWEYWNGSAWVTGLSNAAIIGNSASAAPFLSKVGTRWYMSCGGFSAGCNGGTKIYVNTAANPYGPFNSADKQEVYSIPDRYSGNTPWMYSAHIHPEHTANNELLITYNLNGLPGCESCSGTQDPAKARPRAIRVPISLIN